MKGLFEHSIFVTHLFAESWLGRIHNVCAANIFPNKYVGNEIRFLMADFDFIKCRAVLVFKLYRMELPNFIRKWTCYLLTTILA